MVGQFDYAISSARMCSWMILNELSGRGKNLAGKLQQLQPDLMFCGPKFEM
jgi:hypothetical protein